MKYYSGMPHTRKPLVVRESANLVSIITILHLERYGQS